MRIALTFAALALGGCILQPTQTPDCAPAGRCGECTGRAGCGWCEGLGACVPGSSFGPDDAACALSDWRFTGCANPPGAVGGCHEDAECGGCLYVLGGGASDCQWCPASGECLNLDETCSAGTPTFEYDSCRVDNCRAQTSCGACTSMGTDCRWCDQGGGSCTESYDCDPHYEFGARDRCPPPNTCSSFFGCEACTAQPGCGWCDAPGPDAFCVATDGFGDYADWCSSGDLSLDPLDCGG